MVEEQVAVCVRSLDGQELQVTLPAQHTVGDIKLQLQHLGWPVTLVSSGTSTAPHQFHLFLKGVKLDATTPIKSLSLHEGEFLVLIPFTKKKAGKSQLFTPPLAHENNRGPQKRDLLINSMVQHGLTSVKGQEAVGLNHEVSDMPPSQNPFNDPENTDGGGRATMKPSDGLSANPEVPGIDHKGRPIKSASEVLWHALAADLATFHSPALDTPVTEIEMLSSATSQPPSMGDTLVTAESTLSDQGKGQSRASNVSTKLTAEEAGGKSVEVTEPRENSVSEEGHFTEPAVTFPPDSSYDDEGISRPGKARKRGIANSKDERWEQQGTLLPQVLERLRQVFTVLNTIHGFLQRQHMQATWLNVKQSLQELCCQEGEEAISVHDIENLATLCPKLVVLSNMSEEGEEASFNIDLFDPSKINEPASGNVGLPVHQLQEIGPSDFLPSSAGKRASDKSMRNAIERRLKEFQAVLHLVFQQLQSLPHQKLDLYNMSIDEVLTAAKDIGLEAVGVFPKPGLPSALPRPPRHHKKLARCMDVSPMDAPEMLNHLKEGLGSLGQIVHFEYLKKREASFGQLDSGLSTSTQAALKRLGISSMYSHQAKAINAVMKGQNVAVATSTASGKSLCYNVPVLEELTHNLNACALYLFPTKALAQDQLRVLQELMGKTGTQVGMGVYDGDTPQHLRLQFRESARLLITNPDMLHVSIMPSHRQFERFFSHLRFVVVDEAHAYRGVFGCHTALILRRLRRLCEHLYGSKPSFIACSATVANPREHAMELLGLRELQVVEEDGSPCGEKCFVFWNPPIVFKPPQSARRKNKYAKPSAKLDHVPDPQVQMKRASPIVEVASLLAEMVQHGLRCIAFCNTRKLCELVHNYTREILKETAPALLDTVRAYRAGYTAHDRRSIESDLFGGRLRGVAATNALELGVDVGSLDATLHLGFPGSVTSLWQQSGRAGRRGKASISIYVAFGGPLDQHFMKEPQRLFNRSIEHAQVDACNQQVVEQHLACAAVEHPLHVTHDECYFGSGLQSAISELVKQGQVGRHPCNGPQDKSWHYIGHEKSPSQAVSIRAIDPEKYTVINQATNEVIEEVEGNKAFFEVYEGAVYMHQGKTYLVRTLDLAAKVALCQEADLKYYTKTRDFTDVHVTGGELAYPAKVPEMKYPTTTAQASMCKVTTRWIGFRRIWQGTNETFDSVDLFLPDVSYESQAAWIRLPHHVRGGLEAQSLSVREGIHAASHALLNVMPLYIMCNPSDLGTECAHPQDTRYYPERLLVFDRHPGGIGIAAQARPMFAELLQAALELVVACDCTTDTGCPCCVQYLACSEYNEVIHKHAAVLILQGIIDAENAYREGSQEAPGEHNELLKA